LIDCAGKVVPKATIREMIFSLQQAADKHDNIHEKRSALCRVESLARQIKDGPLFEKTRLASRGTLNARAYLDIAEVYLESGDVETAQDWLKKVDEKDLMNGARRDELLLTLYKKQGDPEKAADILLQRFKSFRSLDTLQEYLDVIGHDKRDAVVAAEVAEIQVTGTLCLSDAYFLISIGAIDTLAPAIIDWGSNPDHQTFKGQIRQAHGRKHSFWSKYEP
jgi:tetratricopeptide (TPR) repeat protein